MMQGVFKEQPEDSNEKERYLGGFAGLVVWIRRYQHVVWQQLAPINTIDGPVTKRLDDHKEEEKTSRGLFRCGELYPS
jgi:hypothetical protein